MAGGRPTTTDTERRSAHVAARFTLSERARLEAKAASLGLRLSDYIRACAVDSLPPKLARATKARSGLLSAEELRALNAIGVNLNQIAKRLNAGDGREIEATLSRALADLQAVLERGLQ